MLAVDLGLRWEKQALEGATAPGSVPDQELRANAQEDCSWHLGLAFTRTCYRLVAHHHCTRTVAVLLAGMSIPRKVGLDRTLKLLAMGY
eukprot:6178236-Pleurochrysis_carterae.AAC.1